MLWPEQLGRRRERLKEKLCRCGRAGRAGGWYDMGKIQRRKRARDELPAVTTLNESIRKRKKNHTQKKILSDSIFTNKLHAVNCNTRRTTDLPPYGNGRTKNWSHDWKTSEITFFCLNALRRILFRGNCKRQFQFRSDRNFWDTVVE